MQLVLLRKQKAELCEYIVKVTVTSSLFSFDHSFSTHVYFNLCRFKSDERTLADALDYVKAEAQKLNDEKEDLLKNLQEENSATCEL